MTAQEGDLRVWCIINIPSFAIHIPAESPEQAAAIIDYMAQDQLTDDRIVSNVFGLEIYEAGEWTDWYSADGEDLDEYMEAREVTV